MLTYFGKLKLVDGKLVLDIPGKEQMIPAIAAMYGDANLRIDIRESPEPQEDWLRKYYHGILLPSIVQHARNLGDYEMTKERMHDELTARFLEPPYSTKALGKNEYRQYVELCRTFAVDFFNTFVPEIPGTDQYFPV
jgi:hypothetical protein